MCILHGENGGKNGKIKVENGKENRLAFLLSVSPKVLEPRCMSSGSPLIDSKVCHGESLWCPEAKTWLCVTYETSGREVSYQLPQKICKSNFQANVLFCKLELAETSALSSSSDFYLAPTLSQVQQAAN